MHILGIITARGGSKSIPRKNIKYFCGKPLISWTIDAALRSGVLTRCIVSTDDEEIAACAKRTGAEVPFLRPAELAQDHTPMLPVLRHAVQWLQDKESYSPNCVVLLQPTSPIRQAIHIKEAVMIFIETGADSVVAVCEVPGHFNPHWQCRMDAEGKLSLVMGEPFSRIIPRRQELPNTYYFNGAIYAFKPSLLFREPPSLYGDDVRAYRMAEEYAIDIDTPDDWERAEKQFTKILKENR